MKKEMKRQKRRRSKSPERPKIEAGPQRPPPARPSLLAAMAPLSTGTVQGDRSGSFVGSGWSHGAPKKEGPLTGLQRAHRDEGRETALHALARKKPDT